VGIIKLTAKYASALLTAPSAKHSDSAPRPTSSKPIPTDKSTSPEWTRPQRPRKDLIRSLLDEQEGFPPNILMVRQAWPYLDIILDCARKTELPIAPTTSAANTRW